MNDDRLACAEAALRTVHEDYLAINAADVVAQGNGHSFHRGMHVGWTWGTDDQGREYLDFLSEHRHPGIYAERYFADGTTEPIDVPHSGHIVTGNPTEDTEIERKFYERNRRVYASLRERGLLPEEGTNLASQDINEYLLKGGRVPANTHPSTFGVLGAIVGDVVGSRYEFSPIKTTEFELFPEGARYTDDTVCTLAIAEAFMELAGQPNVDEAQRQRVVAERLKSLCRMHPDGGYGGNFRKWLSSDSLESYGSYGNGAAMRVSPAAGMGGDVLEWAKLSAVVTHDHPEGVKGAQATAWAIDRAAHGADLDTIRSGLAELFHYDLTRPIDEVRANALFDETCPVSVPEALICFLDSADFESSIRNAVSLGADADTQAAIAGSIAECFYSGVPEDLAKQALATLSPPLRDIFDRWVAFVEDQAKYKILDAKNWGPVPEDGA